MNEKSKRGFTILELVIATFILGALIALIAAFSIYYFQTYSFSFEENQAIGESQSNLTTMIREIREIRYAETGAYPILEAGENSFVFYSDVTNDGRTDRVRYFLDGIQLKRGVIEPTQVPVSYPLQNEKIRIIADHVDTGGQPIFTYYNGGWPADTVNNPLNTQTQILYIRYVSIYLKINIVANSGAQPFELTSGVQIRSLKDNL